MIYIYTCQWCFKSHSAVCSGETICQSCDSELIDLEHPLYRCSESLFLIPVESTRSNAFSKLVDIAQSAVSS